MANCYMTGEEFASFLVTQLPVYDQEILRDVRPMDGEIGHFATGTWPSYSSASHTKDRFNVVFPNLTRSWRAAADGSCVGTPCDFPTSEIGWGNTRLTYSREQIEYKTQLLCFDQITDQTQAMANFQQIIDDILRPSTNYIVSDFAKRHAATLASKKWLANATQSDFTFTWDDDGVNTQYITVTGGAPTSLLTPQMLRRRVNPLIGMGYFGKSPDLEMPPWIELVTDNDTLYDMNEGQSAVLRADGTLASTQWRFENFDNVGQFYKYGWSGKVGNYAVRVDTFPLRFNRVAGSNRYQRVLPYRNIAATNGLKDEWNPDYDNAQYQFSRIHHRQGMRILTKSLEQVNGSMGFLNRSLAGQWRFATNDLGADCNGVPIANYKGNKGLFFADYDMAAEPLHTEWMELIFHLRNNPCIYAVSSCAADPGYPTQNYSASNTGCDSTNNVQYITPVLSASGDYNILANTIQVNGIPIVHAVISGSTTLAALVTELNTDVATPYPSFGTFTQNGTNLILTGGNGATVVMPWVTT